MRIFEGMTEAAQAAFDKTLGTLLAVSGGAGLSIQWIVGFGNIVLTSLNVILAIGGIYLLVLRIGHARRKNKEQDHKDDSSMD